MELSSQGVLTPFSVQFEKDSNYVALAENTHWIYENQQCTMDKKFLSTNSQ